VVLSVSDIESLQRLISMLPGVLGVKAVADTEGKLKEIHILAGPERHPKQIVRDVRSAVAAQLRIDLDHRLISIAQLGSAHSVQQRLAVDVIQLRTKGDSFEASVELTLNDNRYVGYAKGVASTQERLRLLADATISAVEQFFGKNMSIYVEDVRWVQLLSGRAIITVVNIMERQVEQLLAGCAYIKRDEADAVVRATLSAVNRRISCVDEDYSMMNKLIG
jgi:hypothetical protein